MFDDTVSTNDNGGAGRFRQIVGTLGGTFHCLLRKSQVTVLSLIDRILVHAFLLQSMSTGITAALSYRAQASTSGHRAVRNCPCLRRNDDARRPRGYRDHLTYPLRHARYRFFGACQLQGDQFDTVACGLPLPDKAQIAAA